MLFYHHAYGSLLWTTITFDLKNVNRFKEIFSPKQEKEKKKDGTKNAKLKFVSLKLN